MSVIRRRTHEQLVSFARGIVRGDYLVVDHTDEWARSLTFVAQSIIETRNVGVVLVPVEPHRRGYWLNGRVPAVTITCHMIAKGDVRPLQRIVDEMLAALYPDKG